MSSRHRFLQRSINHVSFHNRLTEEELMWRRRENEREALNNDRKKRRHRSRSPYEQQKQKGKYRSSSDESRKLNKNPAEAEFGPPLPSNLGVNADRWDHAFFMQRYPDEYEKQISRPKREDSTRIDEKKNKTKHKKHKRMEEEEEDSQNKSKRRHRSRS
ncbi:unnamed protein product [Rotaria socialis]|uniref:Uncharacterized protein n=1 Tax=Rotaria socialis TaxID=392032 RepID=A0A817YKV6_9BILA|nr:unnamed protein product [Rotaria socialis]CAF3383254.1 unnamed protein product [Rotaria socialis]CAF4403561.1 unnamed protein product [Rotaria socialis]CAF4577360.1 unnamed protein product [Rotaria socialis]